MKKSFIGIDDLHKHPHDQDHRAGKTFSAKLSQVPPGGNANLAERVWMSMAIRLVVATTRRRV